MQQVHWFKPPPHPKKPCPVVVPLSKSGGKSVKICKNKLSLVTHFMLSMMVEGSTDNHPQTDTTSVLHLEMKKKKKLHTMVISTKWKLCKTTTTTTTTTAASIKGPAAPSFIVLGAKTS